MTTPDESLDTLTHEMIAALLHLPASDPLWRGRLSWARTQSPQVAGCLQFAHAQLNHLVEERQAFNPLPFAPLSARPHRVRRKRLDRYAVRLRLVGVALDSAAGWHKVVRA